MPEANKFQRKYRSVGGFMVQSVKPRPQSDDAKMPANICELVEVAVAVATRNRAVMLGKCLESFLSMEVPLGVTVTYLIVENNGALTMNPIVDGFAINLAHPHSVELLHEPELGIPFARNRALDAAAVRKCRWLIFVDDDETVDPKWLSKLLFGAEVNSYDLAGGPVTPTRPEGEVSPKQLSIYEQYFSEARRRQAARIEGIAGGGQARIDLETNNWIGRVSSLQHAGLRFDESMRHTGGTDTDLSRRAEKLGLKLGWIPEAIVYEVMPHDRLSLRYIYKRSRSQTLAKYHIRYRKGGRRNIVRPLAMAFQKSIVGTVRLAFGVFAGTRMQVKGARTLGVAAGYIQGILGRSSDFYAHTGGH